MSRWTPPAEGMQKGKDKRQTACYGSRIACFLFFFPPAGWLLCCWCSVLLLHVAPPDVIGQSILPSFFSMLSALRLVLLPQALDEGVDGLKLLGLHEVELEAEEAEVLEAMAVGWIGV